MDQTNYEPMPKRAFNCLKWRFLKSWGTFMKKLGKYIAEQELIIAGRSFQNLETFISLGFNQTGS
jgi:hypothetical protein